MTRFFQPVTDNTSFNKDILQQRYQQLVAENHISEDPQQKHLINRLQQLLVEIVKQMKITQQSTLVRWLSAPKKAVKSVYIFGEVGRGKSMLMDLFFDACPIECKRRVHFYAFMQEVHDDIHQWRSQHTGDPLPALTQKIRQSTLLLCFDEFQVTDIADAMLLARLFTQLLAAGVIVVATSNQHPDNLYKNGLQRTLFLPFIAHLKQSADIIELTSKNDYRLLHRTRMQTTFYSEPVGGGDFLRHNFKQLTNNGKITSKTLTFKGRQLVFTTVHNDILMTSFESLCGASLSAVDFLVIAQEFNTILLADIPLLSSQISDPLRRFIALIDTLYEHQVKLICTSVLPAQQFFMDNPHFNFKRTRSRLIEMQSVQYWQGQHLS